MEFTGRLIASQPADFTGFRVAARFDEILPPPTEDDEPILAPAARTTDVAPDGSFALELPEQRSGSVLLVAVGRDGLWAGSLSVPHASDGTGLEVPVTVLTPTVVEGSETPTLGMQLRYTGRIIDRAGRPAEAGLVVVLWAAQPGREALAPISVTKTSRGGYFIGPWPEARYAEAFAIVSGGQPVPIALEDGRVPFRVVVVVEELPRPPRKSEDCLCADEPPRAPDAADLGQNPQAFAQDAGRCVDFTVPNRTVEEVIHIAVVRTTQPALNPPDPPRAVEVPPVLVGRLAELARVRPDALRVARPARPSPADDVGVATRGAAEYDVPLAATLGVARSRVLAPAFERAAALTPGIDLMGVFRDGVAPGRDALAEVLERRARAQRPVELEPSVLADLAKDRRELTPLRLLEAEQTSIVRRFRGAVGRLAQAGTGRFTLTSTRQIDWEDLPDRYQATTIAHGHLLGIKQVWRADGYSLGDLLYSLPLAPGQQKLVSVLDWNREDITSRRAAREVREDLVAVVTHDRDISDIIQATLTEQLEGRSTADVKSGGVSIGGYIGAMVFGASGGVSSAGSTASQTSGRSVAGLALNRVRDRTHQAASAVRSQRTAVVQTARQGESVRAQTEVVANYNHCHSVTIQYFEVLRHLQVTQELAHVQECLFIPFSISAFDVDKALRWREPLRRGLRIPTLRWAFGALERVRNDWEGADFPVARYADDPLTYLDAELRIRMILPRPADDEDGEFVAANWVLYQDAGLLPDTAEATWQRYLGGLPQRERDATWEARIAPTIAQRLLQRLRLSLVRGSAPPLPLSVDPALVSRFRNDRPLLVSLRIDPLSVSVPRADVARVRLSFAAGTTLPAGAELRVDSATMRYRTERFSGALFENRRVLNDLSLQEPGLDDVEIATPLGMAEKRNPRQYDRRHAERLLEHLNEHVEFYHRLVWLDMDPNRRFLLLDGFIAPDAGGRSVASVVENQIVAIVGNSLVMPVAPGQKLDPTYEFGEASLEDLRELYAIEAAPAMRISVPTSGVFAEAVMGKCNSCEVIDDTRFWRWEEEPIPDRPTAIGEVSTASRRGQPPSLSPDEFPEPLVRLQDVPTAPEPTGLAAAMSALGAGNIFRDLTGLAANQQNAAQALKSSLKVSQEFAARGAALAQQRFQSRQLDRNIDAIKSALAKGLLDKPGAQRLMEDLFSSAVGEKQPSAASSTATPAVRRAVDRAVKAKKGSLRVTRPQGAVELEVSNPSAGEPLDVRIDPAIVPIQQPNDRVCWAAAGAMMRSWQLRATQTIAEFLEGLGGDWQERFERNEALSPSDFRVLMRALGLVEEPPQPFSPRSLSRLLDRGPLLTIGDDGVRGDRVVHVRIVTGVIGDGTPTGTRVIVADSSKPALVPLDFSEFVRNLAARDPVETGLGVFHF